MKALKYLESEDYNLYNTINKLLEQIEKMRFIQRICRPLQKQQKQSFFIAFKQKFTILHIKLNEVQAKIKKEATKSTKDTKQSEKTQTQSYQLYINTNIKSIQKKYIELFFIGSFKYYQKVADILFLPKNLILINIQQWSKKCLIDKQSQVQCC